MKNENYYKAELEKIIDKFITKECENGDFEWIPETLAKNMAETAFIVLKNGVDVCDVIEENGFEI